MKKCIIVNSSFSWILKVDGKEINFQGSENAEYFKTHYETLGYEVEMVDENVMAM